MERQPTRIRFTLKNLPSYECAFVQICLYLGWSRSTKGSFSGMVKAWVLPLKPAGAAECRACCAARVGGGVCHTPVMFPGRTASAC